MPKKEMYKAFIAQLKDIFNGPGNGTVTADEKQTIKERIKELTSLFDSQMQTLKSRGCQQAILAIFQKQRDNVIAKAVKMKIPNKHIPFVPVIPRNYIGMHKLVHMMRSGDKVGQTYIHPNEIIDKIKVPKNPYFVYSIENGKAMIGKRVEEAEKRIVKRNRSCLTLDESIALCVHSDVLSEHYLYCAGSGYGNANGTLIIWLTSDGPELDWDYASNWDRDRGSASCSSRSMEI